MSSYNGIPMLQQFELQLKEGTQVPWTEFEEDIAHPLDFLQGGLAPSLKHLSLHGDLAIEWSQSMLQNLTILDLQCLSPSFWPNATHFRQILTNCPRLINLSLDGAGPLFEEQGLEKIPPVPLIYLHTLFIAEFTCPYAIFLFSQFLAPSLNDLTLMDLCGDDYSPVFLQLTSAFPKVRLLTILSIQFDVSPIGMNIMTAWLESMPLLAYL
ncbi:hypothetical protein B0H17DRAFT_1129469 [Mycena rosella]|uniref:Uncharacterized protein n=1 Tax=Mycena rosella TaxID=1033263 RepID=A0AAD7GKF7_MYCRO|nr:hypothetical protein B0H17DRAFT_1129469 [Mycena rosella]